MSVYILSNDFRNKGKICFPIQNSCVFPSSPIRHFEHLNQSECKLLPALLVDRRCTAHIHTLPYSHSHSHGRQHRLEYIPYIYIYVYTRRTLHFVCANRKYSCRHHIVLLVYGIRKEINVLCKLRMP